ncbi:MAG: endonuclease, partial [Bacteroidales bacterium]|nr:endonuclease [Bacteroidales bacterium]
MVKKRPISLFFNIFTIVLFSFFFTQFSLYSQIPAHYYDDAYGKSGYQLQASLSHIISGHTVLAYGSDSPGGLWYAFRTSDTYPDGTVWDIYSNCSFVPWEDGHVTYGSDECSCTQQEHTFCQSWFGYDYECPINSDMFHIYPVAGWINGRRSNYPYGEVPNDPEWLTREFNNGAKLGYNNYVAEDQTTYCDISYEPIDEYKGDIARGFFYIATRYMFEDENFSEDYEMTFRSQLRPWALEMMKKWSDKDMVSKKETDRNDIIYNNFQHNRNPYIDYPELAELVFGPDSANTVFSPWLIKKVADFSVTADSVGYLSAELTWINPQKRIDNSSIIHIDSLIIKRNGIVVHTIANPIPGKAMSWIDHSIPTAGYYTYDIFANDSNGNGMLSRAKIYVGQYCPVKATLYDDYYDGWDGEAKIEFQDVEGNLLGFTKLPCGEGWANYFEIKLPATTINCVWIPGTMDNTNAFTLTNSEDSVLYETDYYYDDEEEEYYSDLENINGIFLTFDNNSCHLLPLTIQLTVADTICQNETYTKYGFAINTADSTIGTHNCIKNTIDSIVHLSLTINPTYDITFTDTLKQGTFYNKNGFVYNSADSDFTTPVILTQYFQTDGGCDSIINLQLTILKTYFAYEFDTICAHQSLTWHGKNLSVEGIYIDTIGTILGNDSITHLQLTILPTDSTSLTITLCQGESYTGNGFDITSEMTSQAGENTYTQYLQTINGCDSIVSLKVIVNPTQHTHLIQQICQGEIYYDNNFILFFKDSLAGNYFYTKTWQTVYGCDSVVDLTLTLLPSYLIDIYDTIVSGTYYEANGFKESKAGTYTQALSTETGCDSIVNLHLSVNANEITITDCNEFNWNNITFHQTGTYIHTLQSSYGLDSTVIIHLTLLHSSASEINETACDTFTWFDVQYTQSGDYQFILSNANAEGCDSIITLHLTIQQTYLTEQFATICQGENFSNENLDIHTADSAVGT